MPRPIAFFAVLSAGLGLLVLKAPHMRLAAQIASGQIDGRRIPVTEFVPARFRGESVSVRLGELVFQVPRHARIEPAAGDESFGFLLAFDGLKCRVLPPRYNTGEEGTASWSLSEMSGRDELSRQAAVCAASGADLSFRLSRAEVQLLRERLEIRPAFCLTAERVDVVRGETLCGLLLTWKVEGVPRMVFAYFSPDHRVSGRVLLFPDSDSAEAAQAAQALVSTFCLEAWPIARAAAPPD
ncbi:MAG: hypothetical protein ACPMAQ_01155 [Phycisphaerae bacterium]